MGNCIYCGQKAGFLRRKHKECRNKYNEGFRAIKKIIHDSFLDNKIENIKKKIDDIAKNSFIDDQEKKRFIINGWEDSVNTAFDDHILTEEEESSLVSIASYFNLSQNDLDDTGAYTKVVKGSILRSVINGEIPNKIDVPDSLHFNFQKAEQLVWVEDNVKYCETKTKTRYQPGSRGVSIKIAKGIYFRTGSFKGKRIQYEETDHIDTGTFAVTSKHIYFGGDRKNFRIPFSKIVAFKQYSDGLGIQRDGLTAKPQTFCMREGDGWFIYNLVSNISNIG